MNVEQIRQKVQESVEYIREKSSVKPSYGLILGSGLGELGNEVENATVISYHDIPHFSATTAPGHEGNFIIGQLGNQDVVLMQGRFHTYEGLSQNVTTYPILVMHELGINTLIVTCATGGLNHNFEAGDLMLISDHINFSGSNPLIGPNDDNAGARFPVMFDAYTPELRQVAHQVAIKEGIRLHEGVYCGVTGPVFFTPSELRMLMQWGADSIGMSTVPEVIVAAHRGLKVLGLATITDMAIPGYGTHASGEEVIRVANETGPKFRCLIKSILAQL